MYFDCFNFDVGVFVCVEVLWPSQPNGVMLIAVSFPNYLDVFLLRNENFCLC